MSVRNQASSKAIQQPFGARAGRFLREVRSELKKVTWPTRRELITYTIVVLVSVAIVSLYLGLVDFVIFEVLYLLGKLGR